MSDPKPLLNTETDESSRLAILERQNASLTASLSRHESGERKNASSFRALMVAVLVAAFCYNVRQWHVQDQGVFFLVGLFMFLTFFGVSEWSSYRYSAAYTDAQKESQQKK
ncbi:hypothetical protein BU24DRAFT_461603 [Aaosphaeria arxii CBS 175.79]|uniref:Uncharacterized protein n=1 Tax=Aaosphaeria arxii CBS 175.79 TaxID=1450172 RepID=A0A6A5XRN4_9PLEO|nr:uncharacterized protein BU24DRAFT_461603 [Aaosphaeria arxii CBS 175.79]KAF2015350.1 hypothetical protein BU24DRAFT_461603 [Aaosphaeria arxii CBS 175.79]